MTQDCLSLATLQTRLGAPPRDPLWVHMKTCGRCLSAAVLLKPDLLSEIKDGDAGRLAVADPSVYSERKPLKRGGNYQTWTAIDRRNGRKVVLKELPPLTGLPEDQRRPGYRTLLAACLRREAQILAQLQHPSIVTMLESGKWRDGDVFYAMELAPGETLHDAVRRRPKLEDRLALLPTFIGAVDAVGHAHQLGIAHRDLSPSNIFVGTGASPMPTIIDWTFARRLRVDGGPESALDAVERPETGPTLAAMGTPGYSPREQLELGAPHDQRVDVFALGALLYFLLMGERPFPGETIEEIIANVRANRRSPFRSCPPELVKIMERAMAPDPSARFSDAAEMGEELSQFQVDQYLMRSRYTLLQRFVHWRGFAAVRNVAVTMLIAASVLVAYRSGAEKEQAKAEVAIKGVMQIFSDAEVERARKAENEANTLAREKTDVAMAALAEAADQKGLSEEAHGKMTRALQQMKAATVAQGEAVLQRDRALKDAEAARSAHRDALEKQLTLEKSLSQAQRLAATLQADLSQIKAERDAVKGELGQRIARITSLEADVQSLTAERDSEKGELKRVQQNLQQATHERHVLETSASETAKQLQSLKAEVSRLSSLPN